VNKSKIMKWIRHVAHMGDRGAYRDSAGKPEEKRTLGRRSCRWKNKIKLDLYEVGWWACTGLTWLRRGTSGHKGNFNMSVENIHKLINPRP
jgi:hypothetical protein